MNQALSIRISADSDPQVRLPPGDDSEPFVPKLNDLVEVRLASKVPCVVSGAVRMARGSYFLVSLLGRSRQDDVLVQLSELREAKKTTLLSSCLLQEEVFELPPGATVDAYNRIYVLIYIL